MGGVRKRKSHALGIHISLWLLSSTLIVGNACLPTHENSKPLSQSSVSVGTSNYGMLRRGIALPDRGVGYVRARPGESTRYGTRDLVRLIKEAAHAVATDFPGTAALKVGDLSAPMGGKHSRHGSHRSGRDVDLIFYATDSLGVSTKGRGWLRYDRFGMGQTKGSPKASDTTRRETENPIWFDTARNWHLVRSFLLDEKTPAQWIFCSKEVKARLLRYASIHESSPEALMRALWVMHEPSYGNPHRDHFHIRIPCSEDELRNGCKHGPPYWPWLREKLDRPAPASNWNDENIEKAMQADEGA